MYSSRYLFSLTISQSVTSKPTNHLSSPLNHELAALNLLLNSLAAEDGKVCSSSFPAGFLKASHHFKMKTCRGGSQSSRPPPPKKKRGRRLHPHAGWSKGHRSCLTREGAGEAPGQADKGRARASKGHVCPVKDSVGSPRCRPSTWDLGTAQFCLPSGCTEVWFMAGNKMSIDSWSAAK